MNAITVKFLLDDVVVQSIATSGNESTKSLVIRKKLGTGGGLIAAKPRQTMPHSNSKVQLHTQY
jgi:hypothetical protein